MLEHDRHESRVHVSVGHTGLKGVVDFGPGDDDCIGTPDLKPAGLLFIQSAHTNTFKVGRGFDEFFGILYHLNAGEYPEQYDFPKDENVQKNLGLKERGVIHSKALGNGKQEVKDLGEWGQERQRNLDQEVLVESKRFIKEAVEADKPFFVYFAPGAVHGPHHVAKEWADKYEGKFPQLNAILPTVWILWQT